jgi:hypothetical protein
MKTQMTLAVATLGALVCAPAFADDGISTTGTDSKIAVQAQFEVLPIGSAKGTIADTSTSTDTAVAYGISGTFEYALTPYLSLGVAPRLVLHVISDEATAEDTSDKELDLRARLRAHYPVAPGVERYAAVMPGYTFVLSSEDDVDSSKGFAIAGAVGATYNVSPKLFLSGEIGYQRAFTSTDIMLGSQSINADLDLSYMHIGLGAGTRF